ncbi:DeoR/GlpR family DNA-binding transcription regulator [Demequina sp. SO4-13]|uniref:DeoR/GlpR family DNA-binding transcription regulator n=1 Tax=Demequina sp. SO4-13 TaxID=3401027 RepID=UPI003AF84C75
MYAAERQQRILKQARAAGRVDVAALALDLGVASETVRRDLTTLEQHGSLRRVHGGAIPVERLEIEPTLATRSGRLADVKRRIASHVLDHIPAGATVVLDSGSSSLAIVDLLPRDRELIVITNSVAAANVLSSRSGVSLYLIGGRVRGVTGAAVGEWATEVLRGVVADVAIIGTNGMSVRRGLTTPDQAEAQVKRAMIDSARRVVLAADSSKAGDDHLHRFADLSEIDVIVTDTGLPDDVTDEMRAAGPQVVRS